MVIGGGVVGCSVLYHLTKAGWTDVMLVERLELAAGSSWHAAGDIHTHNGNVYLADLQKYTVELYPELERASGKECGLHMTGGLQLANSPEWMDWLKMVHARGRYLGMDTELISAREAAEMFPLMDPSLFEGAMWTRQEGHVDPSGVTRAYHADLSEGSGAGAGPEPAHAVEDFSQRMLQEGVLDVGFEPLAAVDDPVQVGSQGHQ